MFWVARGGGEVENYGFCFLFTPFFVFLSGLVDFGLGTSSGFRNGVFWNIKKQQMDKNTMTEEKYKYMYMYCPLVTVSQSIVLCNS